MGNGINFNNETCRISKKGLPERHQLKKRICLYCGNQFLSSWCGHRICQNCDVKVRKSIDYNPASLNFKN